MSEWTLLLNESKVREFSKPYTTFTVKNQIEKLKKKRLKNYSFLNKIKEFILERLRYESK